MARILIVDDASFMRASLKYIIENAGHEVVGMAKGGREAVDMYPRIKPDVVTMDILMEGMDGITALGELKKKHPEAKVIMVTALGQERYQAEADRLGAVGYIRKPFKVQQIVQELSRVLGKDEG
jgi:two-component system, chemotaxis family, chemotaxis protein CheY